eukprot:scaffold43944_cov59-Attheya_sp.AAC.1
MDLFIKHQTIFSTNNRNTIHRASNDRPLGKCIADCSGLPPPPVLPMVHVHERPALLALYPVLALLHVWEPPLPSPLPLALA